MSPGPGGNGTHGTVFLNWLADNDPSFAALVREAEHMGMDGKFPGGRLEIPGTEAVGLVTEAAAALAVDMLDGIGRACIGLPPGAMQETVTVQISCRHLFIAMLWALRLAETRRARVAETPADTG